jgi:hypothetical protein
MVNTFVDFLKLFKKGSKQFYDCNWQIHKVQSLPFNNPIVVAVKVLKQLIESIFFVLLNQFGRPFANSWRLNWTGQ